METAVRALVEALHQAAAKYALVVTGGGVQSVAALLSVPGGSHTILEINIPYDEQATTAFLGAAPENYCSAPAAQALATRAYERASWLAPMAAVVGVGCTASLATDRPKRGDHHAHVAWRTAAGMVVHSLVLQKGARNREAEDELISRLLLNTLAEALGIAAHVELALLPGEQVETARLARDAMARFLRGEIAAICIQVDGHLDETLPPRPVLLSGAFNPVHAGHWGMAAVAARRLGQPVAFELSIRNVDKPPLSPAEVSHRLSQFIWRSPVVLTQAPTFVEKAALFPEAIFVIGADTAVRIVAPRYYGQSEAAMLEALAGIRQQRCRFLVACRSDEHGQVLRLADIPIPEPFRQLFAEIPPEEFLESVSSTAIRTRS